VPEIGGRVFNLAMKLIATVSLGLVSLTAAVPVVRASADTRLQYALPTMVAGGDAAYLIKNDGQLWSWGNNSAGQIGDGTSTTRKRPVAITSQCAQISAGEAFTLCIGQDGSLWSWGLNGWNQLGRTGSIYSPGQVGSAMDWRTVEAGYDHGAAIKFDGTLYTWGNNSQGQLGFGDTTRRTAPTKVNNDVDWIAVAAGSGFTLALKANGKLYGCGDNSVGEMANGGTTTGPKTFTPIGSWRWRAISAGVGHVMAIRDNGALYTWGSNSSGQIGNNAGTTNPVTAPYPVTVSGQVNVWRAVAPGGQHSVGIMADGSLWAWGINSHGELGLGSTASPKKTPQHVGTARDWQYVSAGDDFTMLMRVDGSVVMWGNNLYGNLGNGTTTASSTAVNPAQYYDGDMWNMANKPQVPGAGGAFSFLAARDGELLSWGWNSKSQLGDGTQSNSSDHWYPAARTIDRDWMFATGGDNAAHAIKADGTLWLWGTNQNGEFGNGAAKDALQATPLKIGNNSTWIKVADHYAQSIAMRADGTLWATGDNTDGQLGVGSTEKNLLTYTQVPPPSGKLWAAVAVSVDNAYAITSDGLLYSWGKNDSKQLGCGTQNSGGSNLPVLVSGGFTDWVSISAGQHFAVGVRANGQAYAWGLNDSGQLGIGSLVTPKNAPQLVQGGYLLATVASTRGSTLGTGAYGNVIGWGADSNGELGVGGGQVLSMQQTSFWGSRAIAGGSDTFIHVSTFSWDGSAAGSSSNGQLGDGTQNSSDWPTQIYYSVSY
jgi:alpha-tubulin suppressor-like RCC1 family protein